MGVAPDVVAVVCLDDVEGAVVSEGETGAGLVEVTTIVVASAGAPPAPSLCGLVTTAVTMVVSSSTGAGGVDGEDEGGLGSVVGVGPTSVVSGAVWVEMTVKRLFDVTVDGPGGEKENDVGVVVMPERDTNNVSTQQQVVGQRSYYLCRCCWSPLLKCSRAVAGAKPADGKGRIRTTHYTVKSVCCLNQRE